MTRSNAERMPHLPTAWITVIGAYLLTLAAAGAPATTIRARREQLEHMARRVARPLELVTGEHLVNYVGEQVWARETRRGRRSAFRAFWRWAVEQGLTEVDAAVALPRVRAGEPMPRPCPDSVLHAALAGADDRTRLIMRLAAECGLRRAEIAVLHSEDVTEDLVGWSLLVHGKGGKRRLVPCPPGLAQHVAAARGWVFPGAIDGHLSPRRVGELVNERLSGQWTIHSLRHRAGTRWYAVDRDVFTVQELLGHASPATTRRYVEVPRDALRRTVMAAAS